jgi:hypothetical protein
MGVERLFKSFLDRNGRVNSQGVRFLRASHRDLQLSRPRFCVFAARGRF